MKIYVAGHTGLVGSAIVRQIEINGDHSWIGRSRSELDLFDETAVERFFAAEKPDAVVIAAAKVGGIGANSTFPVDFLSDNLRIELNIMRAAHKFGVNRLLFLGSSCIYPKFASQPIKEESLLTGALEPTNESYALAKIVGVRLVESYRKQFGHNWISAMPCNLYGPGDTFDLQNGHVLPSMIRKFHEAKIENSSAVTLWGSGTPLREFLHVDDAASAIMFLVEKDVGSGHLNVGSGEEVSIKNLAAMIAEAVGFEGTIFWDRSKPDGTPRKILDSSRLINYGWHHSIALRQGIKQTYEWYLKNF